jgi:AcrR family transcriptional regulator
MPSEPLPNYAKYFPSEADDGGKNDKQGRILDAAQHLFVRYGVKRTSVEDIVGEAGIAKGTLYLYYDSKDALFAAVAARLCAKLLEEVHRAAIASASLTDRLVGLLDAYVGVLHRLVAESPHIAELTEGKQSTASASFVTFGLETRAILQRLLNEAGITRDDAAEMFLAAAAGTLRIGDTSEEEYRARLARLVDILIIGLTHDPDQVT